MLSLRAMGSGITPPPSPLFFAESMTPHNFFRKQKEYTNEFISHVISVQCDRSTCKKHACNAAIPVACTVKINKKKKMPGFQFPAYKLHVPRQIEILFSALMTLFCEKWPYFITSFFSRLAIWYLWLYLS